MRPFMLLLLAAAAAPALAQKMTPGLWEHQMTMKNNGGQAAAAMAQAQMASMPPEQRKMIEDMLARNGVALGGGAGKLTTVRVCVSPAMAERMEMPQGDGRCKQDSMNRSGNTVSFRFSCSGNPPTRGEGEFTLSGDKAYSGRTVVDTVIQGKPDKIEMQLDGRFVGADCGELKPPH